MSYLVTLCNEDSGVGDTLEVEASSVRQAVLQAIYGMDWRAHARVTVYSDNTVEGYAEAEGTPRFFFSGYVTAANHSLHRLRTQTRKQAEAAEELFAIGA